jgi:hypothetical protein
MRTLMRAFATAAAVGLLAASTALAATEITPRSDTYYEIWCTTAQGWVYLAKRVDASAIQLDKDPGGKDTATEQFNANNPYGEHCQQSGPINP